MRRKLTSTTRARPSRRQVSLLESFRGFYLAKRGFFWIAFIGLPVLSWQMGWAQMGLERIQLSAEQVLAKGGFVVDDVLVEGRSKTDAKLILAAVGATRGSSIFDCDPEAAKQRLEEITWIKAATVQRRLPGTVYIRLVERNPIAVWQHEAKRYLVDEQGAVIENFDAQEFKHLLVVTGREAPRHTKELLSGFSEFPELREQLKSAVFVSGRRWDLIMKNNVRVKLPEKDISLALRHLERLEKEHHLTDGRVATIDLRLPDRSFLYVQDGGDDKKNTGKIT